MNDFEVQHRENEQKQILINRIRKLHDADALAQIAQILDKQTTSQNTSEDSDYLKIIDEVLAQYDVQDEPLRLGETPPSTDTPLGRFENKMAAPMFYLSIVSLILAGLILMFVTSNEVRTHLQAWVWPFLIISYGLTNLVFVYEYIMLWRLRGRHKIPARIMLWRSLEVIFPAVRMGARRLSAKDWMWFPIWGWCKVNLSLFNHLKDLFSKPLIIIALCIIPIMIIDLKFKKRIIEYLPDINIYLEIAHATIWIAFTLEFIMMISVSNEKKDYVTRNWIDLVIIVLPPFSFLLDAFSGSAILRMLRLNQLARVYRVRGLVTKIRQTMILLSAFQRMMYPKPSMHLRSLQKQIEKNRRERVFIEKQVSQAVERIKKQNKKKAAKQEKKAQKEASKTS
ncbi:MAG: ion transporter [Bernardetiaceae bacterium]|nr:ion transporter [Bernardetiaceae bacterium]